MSHENIGIKKEKDELRPLTEKEIRQKLYGSYYDESPPRQENTVEFLEPPKKTKNIILAPEKKSKSKLDRTIPKVSIPWNRIFSVIWKGSELGGTAVVNFGRAVFNLFLNKIGPRWTVGILATVILFLAVSALNEFRAKAMQKKAIRLPAGLTATEEPVNTAVRPSTKINQVLFPADEPPLKQIPADKDTQKPYVIQICIYAREEDARKLADQLNKDGLPAFFREVYRPNAKTYYPVFLGRYSNFNQAQSELGKFRKRPIAEKFLDSFVRTL